MKKIYKTIIPVILIVCVFESCATVFGGHVNAYQRTRPVPGDQSRKLRVGAFIADVLLFWPGTIVDFATCAIYKPYPEAAPVPAAPSTPVATNTAQ